MRSECVIPVKENLLIQAGYLQIPTPFLSGTYFAIQQGVTHFPLFLFVTQSTFGGGLGKPPNKTLSIKTEGIQNISNGGIRIF